MSAPANRWKLGLFVLSGCAVVVAGFTWLGMAELQRPTQVVHAYFDEALTGLEDGSPVRFRGVRIGVVTRIDIGQDQQHLAVTMALYDEYLPQLGLHLGRSRVGEPVDTNLRAQVVASWVTGTAFVQVDIFPDPPAGPQQLPFPCAAPTLRTVPSTAKSLEAAGREVLRELPAIGAAARALLDQARSDLQGLRLPELAARFDRTCAELAAAGHEVAAAAATLRADRGPVQAALVDVGAALAEVRQLAASLRSDLQRADLPAVAGSVRGAADRAGDVAGRVATVAAGVEADVHHELLRLEAAVAAIERLAALLERDPGALLYGRAAPTRSPLEGKER